VSRGGGFSGIIMIDMPADSPIALICRFLVVLLSLEIEESMESIECADFFSSVICCINHSTHLNVVQAPPQKYPTYIPSRFLV